MKRLTSILLAFVLLLSLAFTAFAEAEKANPIIDQVYGGGGKSDTPIYNSFIELYNPSGEEIDLSVYSLKYGDKTLTLNGVIPANGSYLIVGAAETTTDEFLTYDLPDADQVCDWTISNKSYTIELIKDGLTVDSVTAGNSTETKISKQKSLKRANHGYFGLVVWEKVSVTVDEAYVAANAPRNSKGEYGSVHTVAQEPVYTPVQAGDVRVKGFYNADGTIKLELSGRYNSGAMNADGGSLEIVAYNPENGFAYAVSGVKGKLIAVDLNGNTDGDKVKELTGTEYDIKSLVSGFSYSDKGFHTMSHNYHRLIREHLCRGEYKDKRRPVLVNSWEAFIFDFDSDKLVKLARDSAKLGIEMLVIDDGWFGDRCDDDRALGDWYPNEKKLGGSLCELAKRVNAEGLKLGLWMEPEMISENSELFRKHPDWCLKSPDREPSVCRNQLVLDMSRKEVVDYVYKTMSGLLDSANIEYLKWDMNRPLTDVYSSSLPPDRQGEVYHRYMLGVYDLLERLSENYPKLLIEGCSSGGGRFDAGMLYYEPQIWTSDNSDPTERILIQYNTSFAYPLSAISAHISPSPNHANGRSTPLNTRATVAMTGAFGYELDVGALSDEEKQDISRQTEFYKTHYELFSKGEYFRLTNPYKGNIAAWSYVSEDKKQAFTGVMRKFAHNNSIPFIVRMQGLCEEGFYRVVINGEEYGKPLSGSALMYAGLRFPYKKCDYEAFSVELDMIEK